MPAGPSATKNRRQKKCAADYIAERAELARKLDEFEGELEPEDRAAIIARFDGYSEGNALRIAMQDPDATDVRGYRAWQEVGRQVRKREENEALGIPGHGIRIVAVTESKAQREAKEEAAKNGEQVLQRTRAKLVSVFDIRQTDEMTAEQALAYAQRKAGAA